MEGRHAGRGRLGFTLWGGPRGVPSRDLSPSKVAVFRVYLGVCRGTWDHLGPHLPVVRPPVVPVLHQHPLYMSVLTGVLKRYLGPEYNKPGRYHETSVTTQEYARMSQDIPRIYPEYARVRLNMPELG